MAPTTAATRARPFILITGVPGAGKTTLADALAARIGAKRIDVGALCKSEGFHGAYDEALDTHELDEDALLDEMEARLEAHGERGEACVVDYHSCELFPERWFDLVTALTLVDDTATLYERLAARGGTRRGRYGKMWSVTSFKSSWRRRRRRTRRFGCERTRTRTRWRRRWRKSRRGARAGKFRGKSRLRGYEP